MNLFRSGSYVTFPLKGRRILYKVIEDDGYRVFLQPHPDGPYELVVTRRKHRKLIKPEKNINEFI